MFHSTTILAVRHRDHSVMAGDGQVTLEEYVAGGASKFILRPMCPPDRMLDQLGHLAADVVPAFHRRDGRRDGS